MAATTMTRTKTRNKGPVGKGVQTVSQAGEWLDNQAGKLIGMKNPGAMSFTKKASAEAYKRLMEAEGWVAKITGNVLTGFKVGLSRSTPSSRNNPGQYVLQGYHRIRGVWETLQSSDDESVLEQYKPYFAKDTLANFYRNTPFSGFSSDTRPVYTELKIVKRKGGKRRNPESAAAEMFESFHGSPSEEVTEFVEDHHYHENVAELGVLAGVLVETEYAGTIALAFSGYYWDNKEGAFDLKPGRENPLFGGLFGKKTTSYSPALMREAYSKGYKGTNGARGDSEFEAWLGKQRGVGNFDSGFMRKLRDEYFKGMRDEEQHTHYRPMQTTSAASKPAPKVKSSSSSSGKTEYKPIDKHVEVYGKYAIKKTEEGGYTVPRLDADSVFDSKKDARNFIDDQTKRKNPDATSSSTTLLASNEAGTQLFLVGGDQCVDVEGVFKLKGAEADHESLILGSVSQITYHTSKIFDGKREEYDYFHHFSEDTDGPLPVLRYDVVNQKLHLDGGSYLIKKPFVGTSPGIEN